MAAGFLLKGELNSPCKPVDICYVLPVEFPYFSDCTGIAKTAFVGEFQNLLFAGGDSKFVEAGRHSDAAEIIFHSLNARRAHLFQVFTVRNQKNILGKLGKPVQGDPCTHSGPKCPIWPQGPHHGLRRTCRPVHVLIGGKPSLRHRYRIR